MVYSRVDYFHYNYIKSTFKIFDTVLGALIAVLVRTLLLPLRRVIEDGQIFLFRTSDSGLKVDHDAHVVSSMGTRSQRSTSNDHIRLCVPLCVRSADPYLNVRFILIVAGDTYEMRTETPGPRIANIYT